MGDLHEIGRFFLFTGAGFLAGLINTLASSGSAVTLPLLVFMGLPANVANGTNRVPLFIGRLASIAAFHPDVILTPHNAFNTTWAVHRILNTNLDTILTFIDKGQVCNPVD